MFLHGCNYPWSSDGRTVFYGLDFGANVWGAHLGVSTRRAVVSADFGRMASLGFRVARWFIFGDGRSGIVYDDAGLPIGLDAHVFDDLDAALEIAACHGMALVLVALDHRWMFGGVRDTIADPIGGVVLEGRLPHGRAGVLLDEAGQDALLERVLAPVVRRYGERGVRSDLAPQVAAWEFMNEPDWVVEEWESDLSPHVPQPLPFELLARALARFSDVVHDGTTALVTIGGGRARNLWAWDDDALGIDLIQVHHYPDVRHPDRDEELFGRPAASLGLRRAVVLGEFPGNAPAQHPANVVPPPFGLGDYLEFALAAGYAGAWPWSFSGTDAYGGLPEAPLRAFGLAHPTLVNPRFRP